MASEHKGSRRAFVIGGAATAAVVGPVAVGMVSTSSPLASWSPPAPQLTMTEVKQWEALIGKSFKIAGENGSSFAFLAAVQYGAPDPTRPAALTRKLPFTAYFQAAANTAPTGQKTYKVAHPTQGLVSMFVSRGADRRGFAWLTAEFN